MDYLIQPWKHQLEAITRAATTREFGLFFEPGAGKTSTTINILRGKFNDEKKILRTLIFCPPIVIKNWKDEWLTHSKIDPSKVILLTGSGKERERTFRKYAWDSEMKPTGRIFVTNYESLLMKPLFEAFKQWAPESLVADESHKIKDSTAKRTKLACALAIEEMSKGTLVRPAPKYKYILSGSPVLNNPMDIFSQFLFLDGGATFGRSFYAFRGTYFRDKNAGMPKHLYYPAWEPIPEKLDLMNRLIFQKAMRVLKKDCMDLPPLIRTTIKVPMGPKQRLMYEQMKKDLVTFMDTPTGETQAVMAQMALTKALRLMQIASGYVKTVDGEELSIDDDEPNPKLAALEELLKSHTPHRKVIIWTVWRQTYSEIRKVCEKLGLEVIEITGETPAKQRFELVEKFNTDPKARVFVSHPLAGGIGINLVSKVPDVPSDIAVFYSRNFSLEQHLQAEARNYRGGTEKWESVTHYDLVCENSIDEAVTKRLVEKMEISEKILKDLI